ncbi:Sarcosine oxidase gamma subunit [Candidatus Rhodobacter oscarellae]|uniref:Sarcosine oxidase gamma subunit n=1 Tax=Candidatus Rhodobacter oscarellae TaxID=1675527 RepID=A0A0J9E6L8_9RHOB|nr:sarcosine oxidase subunit gamma family protein [Candidatus Rhodobacter lobularis]KMW57469.1 Sarcosine oxidase gamma subunit [Candidatus Rhodobacter lobularis]
MSNAVSALNGASFEGYVTVTDMGPAGMITLRGDLGSAAIKKAIGMAVPAPLKITSKGENSVAWMSPDELLALCPYEVADETAAKMTKALGKAHSLVANVSDARALIRLEGADVREVLAKLTPADVAAMQPGDLRRSRLAQIPAAFWLTDDETAYVICFRSVAKYTFDLLTTVAAPSSKLAPT